MRSIGHIQGKGDADKFIAFLYREGIEAVAEAEGERGYAIWVYCEDDCDQSHHWLTQFQASPSDTRFEATLPLLGVEEPLDPSSAPPPLFSREESVLLVERGIRRRNRNFYCTHGIAALFLLLFLINALQLHKIEEAGAGHVTPLLSLLAYDAPDSTPATTLTPPLLSLPQPTFEKIRQGQLWRLITPSLLQDGVVALLFNLLWLYLLGREVERSLKAGPYLILTVLIAIISNTVQYLVGGPLCIGYFGVICGLVGFVWMRQRVAPWEYYSIAPSTLSTFSLFVLAMAAIELLFFILKWHGVALPSFFPGSSGALAGGAVGIALGRAPLFKSGRA